MSADPEFGANTQAPKYAISVALCLCGENLDPSAVSTRLGIQPSRSYGKGERWASIAGKERQHETGFWALSSDSQSPHLSDHIEQIVSRLAGADISGLPAVDEAYIDVFIAGHEIRDFSETCAFELKPHLIAALNALRLPVKFTIKPLAH